MVYVIGINLLSVGELIRVPVITPTI